MDRQYRKIGILGGMGPEATAGLYLRLIKLFQKNQNAVLDADFPNIIINSLPVGNMLTDSDKEREQIASHLSKGMKIFQDAEVNFVLIPCNTAMLFLDSIERLDLPVLNIIEQSLSEIQSANVNCVGVLASSTSIREQLFAKFDTNGLQFLYPNNDDQIKVDQIINQLLAGVKNAKQVIILQKIASKLMNQGAQKVILGCTELPLLYEPGSVPDSYVDSLQVLADKAFELSVTRS